MLMRRWPWLAVAAVAAVAACVVWWRFGSDLKLWWAEPAIFHDESGRSWYRITGSDAKQQAAQRCASFEGRTPQWNPRDAFLFCCMPPAGIRIKGEELPLLQCDLPHYRQYDGDPLRMRP